MKTLYFSESLNRTFETVEELKAAETEAEMRKMAKEKAEKKAKEEAEKKSTERKARAKEVEDAWKKVVEAQKEYQKLLNAFIKDYHSYHFSVSTVTEPFNDIFDSIFRLF